MENMKNSKIGGQAVLEGVMMRGERSMATAVRTPTGEITVESKRFKPLKERSFLYRVPVLRGVISFFNTLVSGTEILMRSGEVAGGGEVELSRFEQWLSKKTKVDLTKVAIVAGVVLGVAFSLLLFFGLPQLITSLIFKIPAIADASFWAKNAVAGAFKLVIFVLYLWASSKMPDIKRVFMYHGAEHKTINAFEHGEELTVENVRKYTTVHKRCGTTFMFLVLVVSIIVFSFTGWQDNIFIRLGIRLLLLPVVAGLSYELLKLLALSDNIFVRIIRWPGLQLQRLTTREPDDSMLEVAITAFKRVELMDSDLSVPESTFDIRYTFKYVRDKLAEILPAEQFEQSDVDWILCEVLNVRRNELADVVSVSEQDAQKAYDLAKERSTHKPLQYILGYAEFYGLRFCVDNRVLIPRPETELLAEQVIAAAEGKRVLDMCTGSGAIAVTVKKYRNCEMDAADISDDALAVAAQNSADNGTDINFIKSDMFENITAKYDIIVCNPPYIMTDDIASLQKEVGGFEPVSALDGGADGLDFYRIISANAAKFLNEGGKLFLELGEGQYTAVYKMLKKHFEDINIIKDYAGIDRVLAARVRKDD